MNMRIQPEISAAELVIVGDFNPIIFRPDWFAINDLISPEDAKKADIELVHKEITIFSLGWVKLHVDQNRLVVKTDEPPFVRICDLTIRTFKELLSHTPLRMIGINRRIHFKVDEETRNRIGLKLAPLEPWGEWTKDLKLKKDAQHGGMRSLVMEQNVLDDRKKGCIRAKIEPSVKVECGIFIEINDHYEVEKSKNVNGTQEIIQILENNFETSIKKSEWIIDQVMKLV